jgi:glycosyl transferase family 25
MWPVIVINLAENQRRLADSGRQLDAFGIPWRRMEGVDGRRLTPEEIDRVYDAHENARRARHPLVAQEIGCYLSHIAAWHAIADADAPGGFVFEDDFAADPSLPNVLERVSSDAGRWDMIKLFAFDPVPRLLDARPLDEGHKIGIAYSVPTCLVAYGLTREAARRLTADAVPFFRPVDEDQKFFWETGMRVALVTPPPVCDGDQQSSTGTVGDARRAAARSDRRTPLSRSFAKLTYRFDYIARLHLSRLRGVGR